MHWIGLQAARPVDIHPPQAPGGWPTTGTPRGVGELNARAVTAEAERDLGRLASLVVEAVGDFLAASSTLPADHPMPSSYFQGGGRSPPAS